MSDPRKDFEIEQLKAQIRELKLENASLNARLRNYKNRLANPKKSK